MERYEFEGVISDYIDQSLSLSKKQEFENYMKANPEAEAIVASVRKTMDDLHNLPKVKPSSDFTNRLWARVDEERSKMAQPQRVRKSGTFLGFTPLYAGLMAVLVVSFVFVGMELMPDEIRENGKPSYFTEDPTIPPPLKSNAKSPEMMADAEDDSLDVDETDPDQKMNFKNRIQFVKDH